MNKNQIILFSIMGLIIFGGSYLFIFSRSSLKNNNEIIEEHIRCNKSVPKTANIPDYFYQGIDLDAKYVYNITQFGGDTAWFNLSLDWFNQYEGDWRTDPGGQIILNFTDFYDFDTSTQFSDRFTNRKMAFMDLEIYEKGQSIANFTQTNTSNSEIAYALALNFEDFNSGFLIPTDNWSAIKQKATLAATNGYQLAHLTIDDTYNYLFLSFHQYGSSFGNQITELKYDKNTGLLIWAYTEFLGYKLELFLTNYSIDLDQVYTYEIKDFGGLTAWYNFSGLYGMFEGVWLTNPDGKIIVNYIGKYNKDPEDGWYAGDSYPDNIKRVYFDIDILYNYYGSLDSIFYLNNISNREAATQMILGFNGFQPGFFLPNAGDLSSIISNATSEASSFSVGTLTINIYNCSVEISWIQTDGFFDQATQLIYERDTGILLYAKTSGGGYLLEMSIDDYESPKEKTTSITLVDDDDDDKKKKTQQQILSFPMVLIVSIVAIMSIMIILKIRNKLK